MLQNDFTVGSIHGNFDPEERESVMTEFLNFVPNDEECRLREIKRFFGTVNSELPKNLEKIGV